MLIIQIMNHIIKFPVNALILSSQETIMRTKNLKLNGGILLQILKMKMVTHLEYSGHFLEADQNWIIIKQQNTSKIPG